MSSTKSSPRDFSIISLFTAGLAWLACAPIASAYTQPVGASPKGNPIYTPGLHDVVPAGQSYNVTWKPTTKGTVTLVLLKGPSDDAEPQYPIAQRIPNSGSFEWTPSTNLAPGTTGYGIQLIVDKSGQYQYTTQFGISNPDYQPNNTQTSESSTQSATASVSQGSGTAPTGYPAHNTTLVHPTGWKAHNTSITQPTGYTTKTASVPTTAAPVTSLAVTTGPVSTAAPISTTAPLSPAPTNGASTLAMSFVGLVAAAGVAVLAF